jgi:hypothetical protein
MEFSCITILHIVNVIPKEKWPVCIRRCRMYMNGDLTEWCSPWDLLPRMTLSVTIRGQFMYYWIVWCFFPCGQYWVWFFLLLIKCKEPSLGVCTSVWALEPWKNTRDLYKFSNEDIDTTSWSWKTRKLTWWNGPLSIHYLAWKEQISRVNKIWVWPLLKRHAEHLSDIALTEIKRLWESILFV